MVFDLLNRISNVFCVAVRLGLDLTVCVHLNYDRIVWLDRVLTEIEPLRVECKLSGAELKLQCKYFITINCHQ